MSRMQIAGHSCPETASLPLRRLSNTLERLHGLLILDNPPPDRGLGEVAHRNCGSRLQKQFTVLFLNKQHRVLQPVKAQLRPKLRRQCHRPAFTYWQYYRHAVKLYRSITDVKLPAAFDRCNRAREVFMKLSSA